MAVISATRTRKRILATLLAPPRGPFRDPPPVTTHSFPFSSLGPSIRPLRVYAFSTLVPLFLYLSLSPSSSLRVRLLSSSSSSPAVRRLARPCIIYITRGPGVRLHSAAAHTNPFCSGAPERGESTESNIDDQAALATSSLSGGQDRGRSLARSPARSFVRSLARARGFFATIQTFPRDRNALTLSRSTGFADNWMGWITIHERVTCIRRGSASRKRRLGRASMVCTMS